MTWNFRTVQLLSAIEDVLAPLNVIRNPFLCSRLTHSTRIAVSDLADSPPLMRMKASEGEILECCSHSHHIDVVGTQLVSPRFEVRPHSLILRNAAALGAAFEIRDFISRLQGDLDFRLFPTNDGNDFAVHFDHLEQCIAVWRALQIVPFRGQIIDVEAYAPAVQATNETEFRTSVGTPVIEAVNPAQIVESVIAPDVRIWHSVEVPTKKMREIIVAPARNTRYWHVRP